MPRFLSTVHIDLPNKDERKQFIRMHIQKTSCLSLSDDQIDNIAMRSTGMSLAELDAVFELAMRSAVRLNQSSIGDKAFEDAFETYLGGETKQWSEDSLQRTAGHEAGHTVMCWLNGDKPSYLTIIARGNHGGYMQHADTEGKGLFTKRDLLNRIRTSLGGRAAEIVYYGSEDGISTGASGDLLTATRIAEQMICNYSIDGDVGMAYVDRSALLSIGEVRSRVNAILKEELTHAIETLSQNRAAVDKLVDALLEKNHLKGSEIDGILRSTIMTTHPSVIADD